MIILYACKFLTNNDNFFLNKKCNFCSTIEILLNNAMKDLKMI